MSGERRVSKREGTELLRLCLLELCSRNLEIYPLGYANPSDVHWIPIGRGIRMLVAGVLPAHRSAFDSLYFFAAIKNGRMIGYGPVSVFLGFCEMGLNLFPEYRGSEVWFLYSQFMRALHQYLGVECFYLTRYAMGENNEAAIRTGAFWYYWKMGFRPTNPDVRELAESELQKMKRNPKYRSDRRMLRRLSHTEMTFDLSGGRVKPLRMGELGLAATRALYGTHGGNPARARTRCVRVVRERLGIDDWERWSPDQRTAMERIAPLWLQVARLADWPVREKRKLIRFTREKGAGSEIRACQIARNFESLRKGLATLAHSVTIDTQ